MRKGCNVFNYAVVFIAGISFGHMLNSNLVMEIQSAVNEHSAAVPTSSDDNSNRAAFQNEDNGWRSIQVFQGGLAPLANPGRMWYSQAKQDQAVVHLLRQKKGGFFVDLAANHAITLSNSLALERSFDWKGICIEANDGYWYDLSKYRTCQVVGAVIGGTRNEELDFVFPFVGKRNDAGVAGGIVGYDNKDDRQPSKQEVVRKVRTAPLLEIFQRFEAPLVIDYLSLDVEGAESLVMKHFPFDQYKIKVMTVERPKEDLQALLKENGYEMIEQITWWGETLWAHSSFKQEMNLDLGQLQFQKERPKL